MTDPDDLRAIYQAAIAAQAAIGILADRIEATLPEPEPPAERRTVLVNVKMAEESAIALAKQAAEEGITPKQLICRALAAAGVPIDALDLEDRTPRRRAAA